VVGFHPPNTCSMIFTPYLTHYCLFKYTRSSCTMVIKYLMMIYWAVLIINASFTSQPFQLQLMFQDFLCFGIPTHKNETANERGPTQFVSIYCTLTVVFADLHRLICILILILGRSPACLSVVGFGCSYRCFC
jgi:hypothetical protein